MSHNIARNLPLSRSSAADLFQRTFCPWWQSEAGDTGKLPDLLFFCIGTTHIIGDCLGPLVGENLSRRAGMLASRSIYVAGTMRSPIHAMNLTDAYARAREEHPGALIVAVDAGLGDIEQIGSLAMWEGSLFPGIALQKNLPAVGDFSITGIVGPAGAGSLHVLKTVSLPMVRKMADRISHAICHL